jgi:hypothetical protein
MLCGGHEGFDNTTRAKEDRKKRINFANLASWRDEGNEMLETNSHIRLCNNLKSKMEKVGGSCYRKRSL